MAYKDIVRQQLVDSIEGIEMIHSRVIKRNALVAILDIVNEFQESLSLDIGELTALIEINKQQGK